MSDAGGNDNNMGSVGMGSFRMDEPTGGEEKGRRGVEHDVGAHAVELELQRLQVQAVVCRFNLLVPLGQEVALRSEWLWASGTNSRSVITTSCWAIGTRWRGTSANRKGTINATSL